MSNLNIHQTIKHVLIILLFFVVNLLSPYPMHIVYLIPTICFLLICAWLFKRSPTWLKVLFIFIPSILLSIGFYGTFGGVGEGHFKEIIRIYHIPFECFILLSALFFNVSIKWFLGCVGLIFVVAMCGINFLE